MSDESEHEASVIAWMDGVTKDLPTEGLVEVFERGFGALWRRAHETLGTVTLTAILDRVLFTATEQFPFLARITIGRDGLACEDLRERAPDLLREDVARAARFVLIEFLTVLGRLTAEILTPALHAELAKVAPGRKSPGDGGRSGSGSPTPERDDGAGAES